MKYGRAIKFARTARGLTQRELAELIGVGASFVSLLESGARQPSLDTLERVSEALDVPMHLLVLMASGPEELHGIDEGQAEALSQHLLRLLVEGDDDGKSSKRDE